MLVKSTPGVDDVSASSELKAQVSDVSCLAGIGGLPRYRTSTTVMKKNSKYHIFVIKIEDSY